MQMLRIYYGRAMSTELVKGPNTREALALEGLFHLE